MCFEQTSTAHPTTTARHCEAHSKALCASCDVAISRFTGYVHSLTQSSIRGIASPHANARKPRHGDLNEDRPVLMIELYGTSERNTQHTISVIKPISYNQWFRQPLSRGMPIHAPHKHNAAPKHGTALHLFFPGY